MKRGMSVGLALGLVGLAFLLLWQTSYAAVSLPHGGHASGVPYGARAVYMRNDTFYVAEFNAAMSRWNSSLGSTWYTNEVPGLVDGHLTYTGTQQDTDWARWFGVNSCKWWTEKLLQRV